MQVTQEVKIVYFVMIQLKMDVEKYFKALFGNNKSPLE